MTIYEAMNAVLEELERAIAKFPTFPTDVVHASAIVAEEAGELSAAALQVTYEGGTWEAVEEEAIQTAAMAIRLLASKTVVRRSPQAITGKEAP